MTQSTIRITSVNSTNQGLAEVFRMAVNVIHDVISTASPFPYTAKFIFVGVRNYKTRQFRR